MVRIHPDPPDPLSLFNNSGWKVKLFSCARARAVWRVASARGLTGLCIASCPRWRNGEVHKLKRESYLLRCDALGDFALGCFAL